MTFLFLASLNAFAFFYYGLTCLFSQKMVDEFHRFGLGNHERRLTGLLQLLGALGTLVGIYIAGIGMLSTAGLSLLMLFGFRVRVKMKDSLKESLPSFLFMLLNAYLFYQFYLAF